MPQPDKSHIIDGVYYLSKENSSGFDENTYIAVRKKEGRLYPDSIVKNLPSFSRDKALREEWAVRKKSFDKLIKYIKAKNFKFVLEVGCGNGWLTNGITAKCNSTVTGLDLNSAELKQAARTFADNERVKFVYGNIFENIFPEGSFDLILFAASIQYFKNLNEILNTALRLIKPDGEIHIIDSKFYEKYEIESAKESTRIYYDKLEFPQMIEYYFHHSWESLNHFKYRVNNKRIYIMSRKSKLLLMLFKVVFPWIIITN